MKKNSLFILLSAIAMMFCATSCDKDDDNSDNNGGGNGSKSSLTVSPTRDITVNAIDNNEMIFTVSTNVKTGWDIEPIPEWIIVTSQTERNLKIKVKENTEAERTHALTLLKEPTRSRSQSIRRAAKVRSRH